jgi:hypothetical protein
VAAGVIFPTPVKATTEEPLHPIIPHGQQRGDEERTWFFLGYLVAYSDIREERKRETVGQECYVRL